VTAALRAASARAALAAGDGAEVGVVVLDAAGRLTLANGAAERWLARPTAPGGLGHWLAVEVVASLLGRSRAEDGAELTPVMALVDADRGGTYELHAEQVRGAAGDPGTLVLIAPRRAADRTDALQALGLAPREAAVALAVLRGQRTAAIAADLALSPYTVQDHVRHVCDKLGVHSRRELAALLLGTTRPPRLDPHTRDRAALSS
jgi:DNA-binding NarL/FixJ family response regulator